MLFKQGESCQPPPVSLPAFLEYKSWRIISSIQAHPSHVPSNYFIRYFIAVIILMYQYYFNLSNYFNLYCYLDNSKCLFFYSTFTFCSCFCSQLQYLKIFHVSPLFFLLTDALTALAKSVLILILFIL